MGVACSLCRSDENVDDSSIKLHEPPKGHVSFKKAPDDTETKAEISEEPPMADDSEEEEYAQAPPAPSERAPEPVPQQASGGLPGAIWRTLSGRGSLETGAEERQRADEKSERAKAQQERAQREKAKALRKFSKVMTGNGLRVQKHHRGKAKVSVRVIRYDPAVAGLTWESNKIMANSTDSVILLKNVSDVTVEGCVVWITDETKSRAGAVGFETAKMHDAEFLSTCINYLIEDAKSLQAPAHGPME